MRGKVILVRCTMCVIRITPAYAGKSNLIRKNLNTERDHPRLCGEK